MLGLTHPAVRARWFGYVAAGYFFRLCDGDRYIAVLRGCNDMQLVDAIPLERQSDDPRGQIARLAGDWCKRRGGA